MKKWESEKHKRLCMPPERFKGHVATGGSLLGTAGRCKDNTSKDRFSQCVIIEQMVTATRNKIDDTKHRAKPNNVSSNLKHLGNT